MARKIASHKLEFRPSKLISDLSPVFVAAHNIFTNEVSWWQENGKTKAGEPGTTKPVALVTRQGEYFGIKLKLRNSGPWEPHFQI